MITGGHEEAAAPVFDDLSDAAGAEGHGRHAEGHRLDDRGAESIGTARMQQEIEARQCARDVVHEAGAKGADAGERRAPLGVAAEQHKGDPVGDRRR